MGRLQMHRAACVFLCVYLLLPSALSLNRLCYYSAIDFKNMTELVVHECPPKRLCFTKGGRHDNFTGIAVVAKGCMPEADCSQVHSQVYKGIKFSMSYSCCDSNYCNSSPYGTAYSVPLILTLLAVALLPASQQL